ncbi:MULTISPECIES: HAMP domain-containing sensor histidine kinase [unclassified Microbacterium]|uniref:sensor histidine kinase n=1 Tax=unclassified Microbacterium TaxID=2609290 RepID=UPI000A4E793C|nr:MULTISPECIES: HAMP domain-containing sensor histidine kinase [unclassified Microbacterium]
MMRAVSEKAPGGARRMMRRGILRADPRDRVTAGSQLLLSGTVVLLFMIGLSLGTLPDAGLFALGTLGLIVCAIATMSVPWERLRPEWIAVVPIADIAAIALLRVSDPAGGLGLLWALPAMWLATLGRAGLIFSCIAIPATYWATVGFGPASHWGFTTLLLPLVVVALSIAAYSSTRRFAAQRELLDAQAARLAFARSAAVRQEQMVAEVLDTVDFGVVRLSVGGDIVYENDAAGRISSAVPGLHGDSATTLLRAEDGCTELPEQDHPLARARRGESFEDVVVWSEDAEGRRTALTFTARRLIDHRGADSGAVVVARDVTAEREALRSRDDLVASVSHELRTPLTSVLGYLELALDEEDVPERAHRYVDNAFRSGERLLAIVADILSASRRSVRSVEAAVHPRETDVVEIVRASVVALSPLADERVIKVTTSGADSATALADPGRLRQVVDNLLSNAIKFNRDGGAIDLSVSTDGETTRIEVRDTGIGISPADQEHVFDRFFRASEDVAGSGLGLSISHDIIAAHDGRMSVESEPGTGTTFIIELPASAQTRMPR